MRKAVVVRARADRDIDRALDHYLAEAPNAAGALLTAIENAIAAIGRSPALGSPRHAHELDIPGLRFRLTRRFPFLIFYVEGPNEISVLRVLHQHRDMPPLIGSE